MATVRLAPLERLSQLQQAGLIGTVKVLLANNFDATDASVKPRVHSQTIRYRLRHMRELFGDDLRDRTAASVEMILRAQYSGAGQQ